MPQVSAAERPRQAASSCVLLEQPAVSALAAT